MPRVIDTDESATATLGDVVEALESSPFDARDEDAFATFGPMLRRLSNDRNLVAGTIRAELASHCAGQDASSRYGPQVIMLHAGRSFTVRANIWPEANHSLVRANGRKAFFYEIPHDHNVSFLTVGHAGPGYRSDYFEYDADSVRGEPGEHVALRFVERGCLSPGKVQLYRAGRDVHAQLPPDRLSISLNIMEATPAAAFRQQYIFDVDRSTVASIANPLPHDSLFAAAAALADPESLHMLDRLAATHIVSRVRFSALRARARAADSIDDRLSILERGAGDRDRTLRSLARAQIAQLEENRRWLEGKLAVSNKNCSLTIQ